MVTKQSRKQKSYSYRIFNEDEKENNDAGSARQADAENECPNVGYIMTEGQEQE